MRSILCTQCGSEGEIPCPACHGAGTLPEALSVETAPSLKNARGKESIKCSRCSGNRFIKCSMCDGFGIVDAPTVA